MAKDVNNLTLTGRMVADFSKKADGFYTSRIAVGNSYIKDGKWEDLTYFFDIQITRSFTSPEKEEAFIKRFAKGVPVAIVGELRQRNYKAKDGKTYSSVSVAVSEINVVPYASPKKADKEQAQAEETAPEGENAPF